MISFKYFNRFLVASLLLAGHTFNMQAYDIENVDTEIQRLRNNQGDTSVLDLPGCDIEQADLPELIIKLTNQTTGLSTFQREQINTLNLGWNNLTSIPKNLLALFPNGVNLLFSGNNLNQDRKSLFDIPSNVIELAIGWNDFTFLPRKIFTRLENLQILVLSGNYQLRLFTCTMEDFFKCTEIMLDQTAQEEYINEISTRQDLMQEKIEELYELDELDEQEKLEKNQSKKAQDLRIIKLLVKFKNTDKTLNLDIGNELEIMLNSYKNREAVMNRKYQPEIDKNMTQIRELDKKIKQLKEDQIIQKAKIAEQTFKLALLINTAEQFGFE